jgi:predicted extracellular nuclease
MVASMLVVVPTTTVRSAPTELFISEYVEGSSFNKAIEIYNGTGATVDLSAYTLELYSNGAATASQTVALSGNLVDGDVFVIAHPSADAAILAVADVTNNTVINFNGDDTVVLRKGGAVVDVFGQVGVDPGNEWGVDPTSTADNTLRRKTGIEAGDTNPDDAFDPSVEWDGFGNNVFDGLGGIGALPPVPGVLISEYVEGSSFNKAIEVFNGTGVPVDLSTYTLELYTNGSPTATQSVGLSGNLAAGDVFVIAHASADAAILAVADVTNSAVINFNGDDALALRSNGVLVDVFGEIGFDPGAEWGVDPTSTQDNTLRRKTAITEGDTDGSDDFDPSVEWDGFALNTFEGLGSHGTPPSVDPVINEFSASTAGTDVEFVEMFGQPDTNLSGYVILEIEGDAAGSGTVDQIIPVGTTDAGGFWVEDLPADTLENGTITLLLVSGFTGSGGADLDTDNDGTFDVAPWDGIVDGVAVTDGGAGDRTYASTVLGVGYDGLAFAPGGASRIPDGTDTDTPADWVRNDFDLAGIPGFTGTPILGEALNTPGAPNQAVEPPPPPPLGVCGDPATAIHDVQGSGASSPMAGTTVVIEGIVVGDFQNNASPDNGDLNGFHVQEEDADADADEDTSEGVFVFAPGGADVSVGDQVRVRGAVSEFFGLTEITSDAVLSCATGTTLPTPGNVTLPVDSPDDYEAYEGMGVLLPQELTISEYFNFGRFGEIVLTLGRQETPTSIVEPGQDAIDLAAQYGLARITLDDGRSAQNPDPAIHPNGGIFDLTNLFRGGDTVTNVSGVMDFAFDLYRIQPTEGADFSPANPRPAEHDEVGGTLEVASFNVLNYFTTLGSDCGPTGGQDCRGADNLEELGRQRAKIVAALAEMSSDVVGLIEIENNPGDVPTADLVGGLNDLLGAGTYDYIATGAIGTDAIRQAFIYKPASVTPVGDFAILDTSVDPEFLDDFNRPVLAQTFVDNATGGVFTVAVNHLKSKGSDCNDIGDPDTGDGSGNCNVTRTRAAQALVDWLATDPTGSGDDDFLIIGDLNSYDKEDPIDVITGAGYTDLIRKYQGENAYSYVFDGQTGYLDHGLAGVGLVDEVTGATVWHINADEPSLIDYDTSFKLEAQDAIFAPDQYRSSDHDPVIVGLGVCDEIAPEATVEVSEDVLWPPNHKYQTVTATVGATDDFDETPTVELLSVTSDEPDNGPDDGNTVNDIVIVDDNTFKLRAERSGVGDGRVYTITYQVTDDCGNTTVATATVEVPISGEGFLGGLVGFLYDVITRILSWTRYLL